MKFLIILLMLMVAVNSSGQNENIKLGGFNFFVKQESEKGECGYSNKLIAMYRKDSLSKDDKLLLKHGLFAKECGNNSEAYWLGKYEVKDTCVIFYTFWCKIGDMPTTPFGARKQIYAVNERGILRMIDSELYIEACDLDWRGEDCGGVHYLFEQPQNEKEQKQFQKYVHRMEKEYNAIFVFGKQSVQLLNEVRTKLKADIDKYTKAWDSSDAIFKK